jgi:hypothetical protein
LLDDDAGVVQAVVRGQEAARGGRGVLDEQPVVLGGGNPKCRSEIIKPGDGRVAAAQTG